MMGAWRAMATSSCLRFSATARHFAARRASAAARISRSPSTAPCLSLIDRVSVCKREGRHHRLRVTSAAVVPVG